MFNPDFMLLKKKKNIIQKLSQLVTASPDHPHLLNTPGMTFWKTNTTQGLREFDVARGAFI